MLAGKVVKVRWVKNYASAHNHVAVGPVVEETPNYLRLRCRTFHFGSCTGGRKGVLQSEDCVRLIPWDRIEVIHELDGEVQWNVEAGFNKSGDCILKNKESTVVTRFWDVEH